MKALLYDGASVKVEEVPRPVPGPDEVLIQVTMAGICRTDLEIAAGYMNFRGILGHEFVGVVKESAAPVWRGRRVTGEINLPCGRCSYCAGGLGRHCPGRRVLGIAGKDGVLAEFVTLPAGNLHLIPDGIKDRQAVFVEPLAAAYEILEQIELRGKEVAVLGDGRLGILAARVLAAEGGRVVLAGKHEEKLARARSEKIETMRVEEFAQRVRRAENRFEVVVEATGRASGFRLAQEAVRPTGVIVQKTTVAGTVEVDLSRLVVDEVTVIGSRCGPFERALQALAEGRVEVDDLITAVYPLRRGEEAFAAAAQPGTLKVLLSMEEGKEGEE